MEIIWVLIPFAIILAIFFVAGFFWMTNNGQYDDLDSPPLRMLLDDKKSKQAQIDSINNINHNSNKERK